MNIVSKTFASMDPEKMAGQVRAFLTENRIPVDHIEYFSIRPVGTATPGNLPITASLIYRDFGVRHNHPAELGFEVSTQPDQFDQLVMTKNKMYFNDGLTRRIHATCVVCCEDQGEDYEHMVYMIIAGVPST